MFNSWKAALHAWLKALEGLPGDLFTVSPKALGCILVCLWKRLHAWLCYVWGCIKQRWSGKGVTSHHVPSHAPSIPITHPAYKRPDPLIYDQYYLMGRGLAVSWQNRDIKIYKDGIPVASAYDLQPSTTYEIRARIWNGSTEGVVSGMTVAFSYLSFGAQTKSNFIGNTIVDLGVKGDKDHCPAHAHMLWTTPATPGHYCIQVSFAWLDDYNPFNNLGQENTHVVQATSPAQFSFNVGNTSGDRRPFRFEYDTYAIPTPPPCPDSPAPRRPPRRPAKRGTVPASVAARHNRADFPLPPDWTITFDPAAPVVPAGEEIPITATVSPPDSFHGTMPVNIHVFAGAELMGGITVLVDRA